MIDGLAMDLPLLQLGLDWLLTYLLQSTILLGGTWLAFRVAPSLRTPAAEDALWTLALVGGLLTATVQGVTGLGLGIQPLAHTPTGVTSSATAQGSVTPSMSDPSTVSLESVPTASMPSDVGSRASRPPRDAKPASETSAVGAVSAAPTASRQTQTSSSAGTDYGAWVSFAALLLWAAGAVFMLVRRFGSRARFLRRIAPRRPVRDANLLALADQVSRTLGDANGNQLRPQLTISETLTSPIALGTREICLPARAVDTLDESALQSMIGHEYAHLLRRDPQWRVAFTLLESIFWFQPLNRLAHRRQCDAAEQLCDAWVVACTGEPRALATSLLEVADWTKATARPTLVSGMAGARSSLGRRVNSLLESSTPSPESWSPFTQLGVALLVFGFLACTGPNVHSHSAPSPPDVPDVPSTPRVPSAPSVSSVPNVPSVPPAPDVSEGHSVTRDSGEYRATWSNDERTIEVEVDGSVTLSGQLDGIASMTPGSEFVLREEEDGDAREVTITVADDGSFSYDYEEDGYSASFDAAAQRWFEQTLMEASHRLGIGAAERVTYLLDQGGVDAVLAETETIDGESGQRRYWTALMDHADLSMDNRDRVLQQAQQGLDSDYEMRRLLKSVTDAYAASPDHFEPFAQAVSTLDSDYERRQVLTGVLSEGSLSSSQYERVIDLIAGIDSDYEKRRTLDAVTDQPTITQRGFQVLVGTLKEMSSDYEKRRVLVGLLQRDDYTPEQQAVLLKTATQINSDYEKRRIVENVSDRVAMSEVTFDQLLEITRSISSDYETSKLLTVLLERNENRPQHLVLLLEEAQSIGSEHTKRSLLRAFDHLGEHEDEAVRNAFNSAVYTTL